MRGILINPCTQTITEIEVKPGLEGLYEALRADRAFSGMVELMRLGPSLDLWIDEEGNLSDGRPVFIFANTQPIAGAALMLCNDGKGDSISLDKRITLETINDAVRWTGKVTTGAMTETTSEDTPDGFVIRTGEPIHRNRTAEELAQH